MTSVVASTGLDARLRRRDELDAADVAAMHALFERYYAGGSAAVFAADLANKSHVVELRDGGGRLCGFSTLATFGLVHEGRPLRALFSGDTIIDHAHRGEQALPNAFCRFAGAFWAEAPEVPLYWLLISKGQRTYRYLHAFARTYFPAPGRPTPPAVQSLLDALCRQRFGADYDAASGLVRLDDAAATRLRAEPLYARADRAPTPEAAYFLARNPGFAAGDELACVCALAAGNLRSFALREFRRGAAGVLG